MFIKIDKPATTPQRKIVLEIVEDFISIQTENVLNKNFTVLNNKLSKDKIFDLSIFQRVF